MIIIYHENFISINFFNDREIYPFFFFRKIQFRQITNISSNLSREIKLNKVIHSYLNITTL